jgi:hypothetical protein
MRALLWKLPRVSHLFSFKFLRDLRLCGESFRLSLYLACFSPCSSSLSGESSGFGNDADDEKLTEDPKFRFRPNNRGVNLSKRVKNRTGGGENGTLELCPRWRGKFQSSGRLDRGSDRPARISSAGGVRLSMLRVAPQCRTAIDHRVGPATPHVGY